ncbi:MAG TPA: alpha/beta fold hydrolase [Polyangiaceae bacterium]|jgi:pimeloyl-ACP methyl ester carboxylesterase
MNRAVLALGLITLTTAAGGLGAACSSSSNKSSPGSDSGSDSPVVEAGGEAGAGFEPTLPCTDSIASVYADPGDVTSLAKGAIIKCAHDTDLSASAMLTLAQAQDQYMTPPYKGAPFTSGAHVYRVLYRTERGDPANSPGYSSALVLLPDTPRAGTLPVVVASHGSRGQAGICAPSMESDAAADVNADFIHQVYPLVGFGYAVIAPDLAGYANFGAPHNPPSAYADTQDVGKSTLDGVAALRNVLPTTDLTQQIVIVGHSQGGQTALSALAIAGTYPVSGTIAAVAVYAPLWISQRAWGAIFLEPSNYGFAESSAGAVDIWYHYTHATLLDGQDAGADGIFDPTKFPLVQSFVNSDCWGDGYQQLVEAGTSANDFFTAAYIQAIGIAATPVGNGNCSADTTGECNTWIARMTADWPHLTGAAAKVPILVEYANDDTTITPDVMQCVFNRLSSDGTNYKVCYDTSPVGHSGSVAENSDYVADWIAQQTLNGPAPTETCTALDTNEGGVPQLEGDGGAIPCNDLLSTQ